MPGEVTAIRCPCDTGKDYEQCCQPLHSGVSKAVTALDLMRSRYSAFVIRDSEYLLKTWHPSSRPLTVAFDTNVQWSGLTIISHQGGGAGDSVATVVFTARFTLDGESREQRERSTFQRVGGDWLYLDGVAF